MASYSRLLLSGASFGLVIPVAATATPGTLIHTCIAGTINFDEIYLWASNVTSTPRTLTLEWGGFSDPGNHLIKNYSIPAYSIGVAVAPGLSLNSSLVVTAFSDGANAINITGYVNRILG